MRNNLKEKVSAPVWKPEITAVGDLQRWLRNPLPEKLALTSPTSGSRTVGIVRSRTQAIELSFS
jgi:hypothetical protein